LHYVAADCMQDDQQKALSDQHQQFAEEVSKQIGRLHDEYNARVLAASQEPNEKLATVVLEKDGLEAHVKTLEEKLRLADQQHQQALAELERQHNEQLMVTKQDHKQQLEDLEVQHERRVTEVEMRHAAEIAKFRQINDQLGKVQQETSTQLDQVKAKKSELETQLNAYRNSTIILDSNREKEDKDQLAKLEAEKSHVKQQLKAFQDQVLKLETEKSTVTKTNKELRERLESKVAELQQNLEESNAGND